MTKPWWETHPKELWTAEDRRAARKAGVLPPLPTPPIDPAVKLAAEQGAPKEVAVSLYGNPDRTATERRRRANEALEKAGLRPGPW